MDYELLGKRIRDERLLLRLTIEQLAERVDKSTNYIGQIERNDGKPSLETIVDIANALGIKQQQYSEYERGIVLISIEKINTLADFYNTSVDYLMGRTDERKPYPKSILK